MAKKITPPPAQGDQVIINLPDPTTFTQANFIVSGTSTPSNATVLGTLTDSTSGNRIVSTPPSVICAQNPVDNTLGDWTLQFANVPNGSYILAVNQGLPNQGADSVNVTVNTPAALTLVVNQAGGSATVTNNGLVPLVVSVVTVNSKPEHADDKHARINPGASKRFNFAAGLTAGRPVIAFAVGAPVKGVKVDA